jgi:hypothetical protein
VSTFTQSVGRSFVTITDILFPRIVEDKLQERSIRRRNRIGRSKHGRSQRLLHRAHSIKSRRWRRRSTDIGQLIFGHRFGTGRDSIIITAEVQRLESLGINLIDDRYGLHVLAIGMN